MFGVPNLAINEYLEAGYYETFHWMNYNWKKGLVCDLTKEYHDMSLLL